MNKSCRTEKERKRINKIKNKKKNKKTQKELQMSEYISLNEQLLLSLLLLLEYCISILNTFTYTGVYLNKKSE